MPQTRCSNIIVMYGQMLRIMRWQYDDGDGDLSVAALRSRAAMRDVVGGGDRELIQFYLKQIDCPCLKAKYKLVQT